MTNLTLVERQDLEDVFSCLCQRESYRASAKNKILCFWRFFIYKKRKFEKELKI